MLFKVRGGATMLVEYFTRLTALHGGAKASIEGQLLGSTVRTCF